MRYLQKIMKIIIAKRKKKEQGILLVNNELSFKDIGYINNWKGGTWWSVFSQIWKTWELEAYYANPAMVEMFF